METMVTALWMETFRLPANDARFLQLTVPEALEQVMMVGATKEWRAEQAKRNRDPHYDDREPFEVDAEITTGEEAAAIADAPNLLGDAENDEIELAETSGDTDWAAEYEAYLKEKGAKSA